MSSASRHRFHGGGSLSCAVAAAILALLLAGASAAAASPAACRVRDLDTGITKATLQKAVGAAHEGDRLTVRGTCRGTAVLRKDLVIGGIHRAGSGTPTLDGSARGSVVTVEQGVTATLRNLTVRGGLGSGSGGPAELGGGGIFVSGTLTLQNVVVTHNTAAGAGGGIFVNDATLRLTGSTSIRGNVSGEEGGGVLDWGLVVMRDSSSITGNRAASGGGVFDAGTLVMRDSSVITGNTATIWAGGISNHSGDLLVGVTCGPGGNVHDNVPDDCP